MYKYKYITWAPRVPTTKPWRKLWMVRKQTRYRNSGDLICERERDLNRGNAFFFENLEKKMYKPDVYYYY